MGLHRCPWQGVRIHKTFEDTADAKGSAEVQVQAFRRVGDEIKDWTIKTFN